MRSIMDEMFVGDSLAVRRITKYLGQLVDVIHRLRELLLELKFLCDPELFYSDLRPWLRGEDSKTGRKWEFEGLEQDRSLDPPKELSGASAAQSTVIHALDIFLGIDKSTHSQTTTGHCSTLPSEPRPEIPFLQRMQVYMPRYHRSFLDHLAKNPRQLRDFVSEVSSTGIHSSPPDDKTIVNRDATALLTAYNAAVLALKEFRDAHLVIAALYVIIPSRNGSARGENMHLGCQQGRSLLRGTGGTDLVRFLREIRDRNMEAIITT
jgi:indoleamine 2,3-dioxygenase